MQKQRVLSTYTSMPFVLGVLLSCFAQGEDWGQYRGRNGDGRSLETIGPVQWEGGPKELWKVPTPRGFSSLSVAKGRAFTLVVKEDESGNPRETCIALDIDSGDELWSTPLGSNDYDRGGGDAGAEGNGGGDGPRSTPATDGDHVYVYDAHLHLYCLDAKDGRQVWGKDIVERFAGRNISWKNATSPILDGDAVFVAGGGPGQSFLAFHKDTGELLWKSGDEEITHATPVLANLNGTRQLIFFMQSGLIGVRTADGTELWQSDFDYATSSAASPVVEGTSVYCSAGYGVGAGLFRIGADNDVETLWVKKNKLMNHWSTPVVHNGHLYGLFEFKKYGTAPLQCVELATGEIKWSQRGFGPGNCILAGEKLIVLSDFGDLVLVSVTPEEYRELGRAKVLDGKCWSMPAIADGRIYIRSTKEAACINVSL